MSKIVIMIDNGDEMFAMDCGNEAQAIFKKLVANVVNSDIKPSVEPNIIKRSSESRESARTSPYEDRIKSMPYIGSTLYNETPPARRKLIFYKCPDCDKETHILTSQERTTCTCGKVIDISKNRYGRYSCPNCEQTATFYFNEGYSKESMTCKGCSCDIDMKYHDGKEMYLSVNMFR